MIACGIESSAHTFGVGIVSDTNEKCNILANEKSAYTTQFGGIHPREAMEHHLQNAQAVIENALQKANVDWDEIDLISFSQGPGLGPCLRVGAIAARALSLKYKKPLLGVNHCIAHIEIGKALTQAKDPIIVYVSGANTQITGYESGRYRIYGETLDIGVGNLLDVFGRALGIGFPAGPALDKMYFESQNYIALPYTVKGMDLTFSGLLTAAENKAKSRQYVNADLAYSLLHTAFAMVTEVAERALAHTEKNEILLTGGVAASRALQQMMQKMCDARNAKMFVPPASVAVDNGSMIGWLGLIEHKAGIRQKIGETKILPMQRTDQVEVKWA